MLCDINIAFILGNIEPTGGDRICFNHIQILRNRGANIDVYYKGFLDTYYTDTEFADPEVKKLLFKYDELPNFNGRKYNFIVGSGLSAMEVVNKTKHPYRVWFCQNFDPLIFSNYKHDQELKQYIDEAYNECPFFITYSPSLLELIENKYGEKISLICTNGVEYDKFEPYQKTFVPRTKRICFMSAYLRPIKGGKFAKAIFEELKARGYTTVEINAIGNTLGEDVVDEYHLRPSFEEKCKIIAGCDIMIHPSVYETWGLVPMESMALGTPVVGVDSKGFTQYAKHNKNAVIVPERDVKMFCDAVDDLYNDADCYNMIQKRGIVTAKKHNWAVIESNITTMYETIIFMFERRQGKDVLVF